MMDSVYNILVNRVPGIRQRYWNKRSQLKGIGRLYGWIYLICLNAAYYIFQCRQLGFIEQYPYYEAKQLHTLSSESSITDAITPEELIRKLSRYEVISLDVFDTLVLRPFEKPDDLFYLVGERLDYPDFKRIRIEMETRARQLKYKAENHYEVSLGDIYTLLERETGIDKETGMAIEIELECQYCFANPYMEKVVQGLKSFPGRIIIISDMYLNTEHIKKLLQRCGYGQFGTYYVSSDCKKSKNEGSLYDLIKKREGKDLTYIHVGDNFVADVVQAQKHLFSTHHYQNVNHIGRLYRPEDMSVLIGGVYRGMVNAHIHNGLREYSREYEYGYIYGGLFVAGYCQFIHQFADVNRIEKILFLSRDGDILSRAYDYLYPGEKIGWEYVYWSRLAAVKMTARKYKYDYFRRFLYHKVGQHYTLEQIFASMEIEDMLEQFCEYGRCKPETHLSGRNVEIVKTYLLEVWERVLEHYESQIKAGEQYYQKVLCGCKKVAAVDIGWAGSGAIALNYLVNEVWQLDCAVTGIVAGTNTCHNSEPDMSETFLQSGRLISYLYSQRDNRDLWKLHDPGKGHNLYWELLLGSRSGSLERFYLDKEGNYGCCFKDAGSHSAEIEMVQQGIMDFVKQSAVMKEKMGNLWQISGRDAYAPMVNVLDTKNKAFLQEFENLVDDAGIG